MRVLVGCEESGIVRDAFSSVGADAWSCDLLESRRPGNHLRCDVFEALRVGGWDLVILHPPCDDLALSGARWFGVKGARVGTALDFVRRLWDCSGARVCLEQPMSIACRVLGKRSQEIHPWQFGHGERKATWLWLRGLALLRPTLLMGDRFSCVHRMSPGPLRKRLRSETYVGVAKAMARQWGAL